MHAKQTNEARSKQSTKAATTAEVDVTGNGDEWLSSHGAQPDAFDAFDAQSETAEDRGYKGTTYAQVRDAMLARSYQRVWGALGEPALPVYDVRLSYLLRGLASGARRSLFREASARTVDSRADLRWGEARSGFRRIVHPNGICLLGRWEITEPTTYSGYFGTGAAGLLVARYSACCSEPARGHMRSLSLAGKLYPTTDPQHAKPLTTANFFTQQDIGGDRTDYINDVELLNAPNTSGWRRGFRGFPILLATGVVFAKVDRRPSIRQLYQIAELGKPRGERTRAPEYMRLLVAPEQPRIQGEELDFRDEIMAQIYDRGDPTPKRTLQFDIEVTDDGETFGPLLAERRKFRNWRRIGRLSFSSAVASYNADYVLHFNHPSWRSDRNDPTTAARVNGEKVRGHWLAELLLGSKAP
jgi:hypothetical protein